MNEIMAGTDPTENLKKKPRKSILKSSSSFEVPEAPTGSKRKNTQHQHKETKWDEENIKETLHPPNKDYGHMKIEEPKTPYEKLVKDEVDSLGVDPVLLAEKLQKNLKKKSRSGSAKSTGSTGSSGGSKPRGNLSDSSDDEAAKKKQFESKRKAHYNEFLAAKEALKNLKDDDEEDE
ncbi:protein phosphatase inhibitor 2-like [Cimex lectularius]|uniref:Protein phosphatase inhibitor 2 n=1 Tax=Cimex lectularius TaxID=79782 RepID=A0A8I6RHB3_CIMLE|nr:protein phosphatase inhibitor 2-like [Cimex lectularius]